MRSLAALGAVFGAACFDFAADYRRCVDAGHCITTGAGGGGAGGGSAGGCVEDADNCGACGRSCLGSICRVGRCEPVLLAAVDAGMRSMVADHERVYWVDYNAGNVRSVTFDGGQVVDLSTGEGHPLALSRSGARLYWINTKDATVRSCLTDGGAPVNIAAAPTHQTNLPAGIVTDQQSVYWTFEPGAAGIGICSAPLAARDGGCTQIGTWLSGDATGNLTMDGTQLYFTEGLTEGLLALPLDGGMVQRITQQSGGGRGLSAPGGVVFWARYEGSLRSSLTVTRATGGGDMVRISDGGEPYAVATDSTHVYWTQNVMTAKNGTLRRATLDGGPDEWLASYSGRSDAITLDALSIIWGTDEGQVFRLAK